MALTRNNIMVYTADFRVGKWKQRIAETAVSSATGWDGNSFLVQTESGQLRYVEADAPKETVVLDTLTGRAKAVDGDDHHHALLASDKGELFASKDGGSTWGLTLRTASIGSFALGTDGWGLAAYNEADLMQTSDGGEHWDKATVNLPGPVVTFAIKDKNHGVAQVRIGDALHPEYVLFTIIEGRWTRSPSRADFTLLRWGTANKLFGFTSHGDVIVSANSGQSWETLASNIFAQLVEMAKKGSKSPQFVDATFPSETEGWAIGDEWVLHTSDGGRNWSTVEDAEFPDSSFK